MQQTLTQRWRASFQGRAGHRFQDRYAAARKSRQDASWAQRGRRVLRLLLALVATLIGFMLAFVPGPAIPFFIIAGGLLSAESRSIARLLDWGEVKLRALWKWGNGHWRQAPGWGRAVLVTFVVCLSATSTYISYRLLTN